MVLGLAWAKRTHQKRRALVESGDKRHASGWVVGFIGRFSLVGCLTYLLFLDGFNVKAKGY
jgi:hypothetical protein